MLRTCLIHVLLTVALAGAAVANAQPLTLASVVDAALARHPEREVPAAISGESRALAAEAANLLADSPQLVVRHATDAFNGSDGLREWEAGVAAPLWVPGQKAARREAAVAKQGEADTSQAVLRWRVAGEVRERLWDALIAHAVTEEARQALASARSLERDVARRVKAGELAETDLLLVRRETLVRETALLEAEGDMEAAMRRYRSLTGTDTLPGNYLENPRHGIVPASALDSHPRLAAAAGDTAAMAALRDIARADRHLNPTLELTTRHERGADNLPYQDSLNLEIRVPLGRSAQRETAAAQAQRQAVETEARGATERREVELAIAEGQHDLVLAEESESLAKRRSDLTERSVGLAQRAFDLGESDLFNLLRAREQANEARRDHQLARLEKGRAAARLNQALGVVPQ